MYKKKEKITIVIVVPEILDETTATADIKTHTIERGEFLETLKREMFDNSLYPDGFDRARVFDVAATDVAGYPVDIWVDDEGLYRETLTRDGKAYALGFHLLTDDEQWIPLAGALCFASVGEDGEVCDSPVTAQQVEQMLQAGVLQIAALNNLF